MILDYHYFFVFIVSFGCLVEDIFYHNQHLQFHIPFLFEICFLHVNFEGKESLTVLSVSSRFDYTKGTC